VVREYLQGDGRLASSTGSLQAIGKILRTQLCLCVVMAAVFLTISRRADATVESEASEVAYATIAGSGGDQSISVRLKPCMAGSKKRVTLYLKNANEKRESIELVSAEMACKCTDAKIPKGPLGYGEIATLTITIDMPKRPSSIAQTFWVKINTKGATDSLHLMLRSSFEDYVGFIYSTHSTDFSRYGSVTRFTIPILVSEKEMLDGLSCKVADELPFLTAHVCEKNEVTGIRCEFDERKVGAEDMAGEIILLRDGKEIDRLLPIDCRYRSAAEGDHFYPLRKERVCSRIFSALED
jgi:hypothetical protein